MTDICTNLMLSLQMTNRSIGSAKILKKSYMQSQFSMDAPPELDDESPRSETTLLNRVPLLSSYKGNPLVANLTVSTELPSTGEANQCDSGGSSPPPPALSPASSSPSHLLHGLFTQTSSPSPPVIVAEIGGNSSGSSRAASEKANTKKPSVTEIIGKLPPRTSPRVEVKTNTKLEHNTPRLSSSCSSSSSATSSVLHDEEHVRNGLPILEKISIAMGSPRKSISDTTPFHRTKEISEPLSEVQMTASDAITSPTLSHRSPLASTDCQVQCHRLEQVPDTLVEVTPTEKPKPLISRKTASAARGPRKRTPRGGTTRKRKSVKCRRVDSDSDFEIEKTPGRLSRGKSDAAAAIRRVRQKTANKRSSAKGAIPDAQKPTTHEATINRRYLESPFLCLCQSGGTVASLSETTALIQQQHLNSSTADNLESLACTTTTAATTTTTVRNCLESVVEAASMPAHMISPALRGLSGLGSNPVAQNSHFFIPPSCPLNQGNNNGPGSASVQEKITEHAETRTIFSGLSYKPSIQLKSRDIQQSLDTSSNQSPWLCAFCGEDNNFLDLGSLYGPYWISASEKSQIIAECVAPTVKLPPASPPVSTSSSSKESRSAPASERRSKSLRSGVITSTLTRSAAAQGRTTVANMGALRLVIKAPGTTTTTTATTSNNSQSATDQKSVPCPRVGADGEVWVHLECVLWAPGTYILGDGTIGGLGEALQLSLDAVCSHCDKRGAILNCCSRGCNLSYHYHCALRAECHLDHEQFTLLCKKHHVYS